MSLTEEDTLPLLTSEFWVRPVYEELLHAASRFNLSPTAELKRPASNSVKIASHVKSKPGDAIIQGDQHTTMTDWLVKYRDKNRLWFDDPAMASDTSRLTAQRKDAVKSRELHFHLGAMDVLPTLIGKLKIDWLDFPVNDILQQFTLSRKEFSVECSNKKRLVRGLGVVRRKKHKSLYSYRAIAV